MRTSLVFGGLSSQSRRVNSQTDGRTILPLLGGEGRGEDERLANF
ncbi:MAG: hypothetical protein JWM68_720, partial [Verrucomicrobiales bacterium]|nr:hypothetical protein [Verrucomicrobiales bacterium]